MAKKEAISNKRRLRSSYFTSIISISLVLVCLGFIGLLLLNAKKLSEYVKENIGFTVFINNDAKDADIRLLVKKLDAKDFVKSTDLITKEEAVNRMRQDLGEDFIEAFAVDALSASIDVKLKAAYANPDSIGFIKNEFQAFPQVKEVYYEESLVYLVNENIRKLSLLILIPSCLLFLIALALINNTIRLSIYSKRFIIKTMQLVGATGSFIRKPFLLNSAMHGIYSAIMAMGMLTGIIYMVQNTMEEVIGFDDIKIIAALFTTILIIGILITIISTFFAVNKFLRMKIDNLYF